MFQHVDIKDGVETIAGGGDPVAWRIGRRSKGGRSPPAPPADKRAAMAGSGSRQSHRFWLPSQKIGGIGAQTGANFDNLLADQGADLFRPIGFPVLGVLKEVKLAANIL